MVLWWSSLRKPSYLSVPFLLPILIVFDGLVCRDNKIATTKRSIVCYCCGGGQNTYVVRCHSRCRASAVAAVAQQQQQQCSGSCRQPTLSIIICMCCCELVVLLRSRAGCAPSTMYVRESSPHELATVRLQE